MDILFDELKKYLKENYIPFTEISDYVVAIGDQTYELHKPNTWDVFFDVDFHWACNKTEYDNYVYKFGSVWYWLKRGDEHSVKLNRLKYLGESADILQEFKQIYFLGVHGPFELLNGSGNYKDWIKKAKWLGIKKLGICEKGTLAGALKFQEACLKEGIEPIIGMEVPVQDDQKDLRFSIKVFVKNEEGWQSLLYLNKIINVENFGFVKVEDILDVVSPDLTFILDPKTLAWQDIPNQFFDKIPELFYQLDTVEYAGDEPDNWYLRNLKTYYSKHIPPVAMCDAYYLEKEYAPVKLKLNRIAGKITNEAVNQHFKNGEEYVYELEQWFKNDETLLTVWSDAINNLKKICEACTFKIETGNRHLPTYYMTPEEKASYSDNESMLHLLTLEGMERKYDELKNYSDDTLAERIDRELKVIREGGVTDYFLILRDIVNWCEEKDILLGAGRGSAAGSLVSYLLGITKVNPLKYGLLFERFLNEGRAKVSLPDIDSDFPGESRPEIKHYIEQRFGINQVCSVGTYTTLQLKAAITDLARLEGIPIPLVKKFTKGLDDKEKTVEEFFKKVCSRDSMKSFVLQYPEVINDAFLVLGQPKAASIHACAMMIFPDSQSLYEWAPVRKQKDMIVSEWEGNELDKAGFLKEDILGIEQLDKFTDILRLIEQNHGKKIDLYKDVDYSDPMVFEYFKKGYTGDVFHFGAGGLSGYVPQLQPESVEELSDCAALYRPGTIENNYHNEYLLRKAGERSTSYRPGTEKILGDTYGLFVYQEQIMALMNELGGMDLVTCDTARKAMGKKKIDVIKKLETQFVEGYSSRYDVTKEEALAFFNEIVKSSSYLFNKSHSVSYSINGYHCQWLKVHYPIEFWSVAFSRAKEEKYPYYINEISKLGSIKILPVHINKSGTNIVADLENNSMYWAINSVNQVGEKAQEQLTQQKEEFGVYFDFNEFLDRNIYKGSAVNKSVVENLVYSGAFDELELIESPKERIQLIDMYRNNYRVKVDGEKDPIVLLADNRKLDEDWWWLLQQKKRSKFALFDYNFLAEKYFYKNCQRECWYCEPEQLYNWDETCSQEVCTGGYVIEVQERESPKKGKFCNISIENNYNFITFMIPPEVFESNAEFIRESKDKILFINGYPQWNKWHEKFVIQAHFDTSLVILE